MGFPLLVSQVNKTWRSLAHQSSWLWSSIVFRGFPKFVIVPLSPNHKVNPNFYYPLIAYFLQRSRKQPLDIHIDIRDPHHDYTIREVDVGGQGHPIDTLMHLLTPHGPRFKTFRFIANSWIDTIQLLRHHIYQLHMPQLESFELSRAHLSQAFLFVFEPRPFLRRVPFPVKPDEGAGNAGQSGPVVQRRWPSVRRVIISGTPLRWSLWCFPNLESLTLTFIAAEARPSPSDFRAMLRSVAHSLRHLDLQGSTPILNPLDESQMEYGGLDPIQLPALCSLSIGYTEVHHLAYIIRSVGAPSIVSLEICDLWPCYREFCQQVEQMNRGYVFDTIRDASGMVGMIMSHMPFNLRCIQNLTLRYMKLQPGLIDALSLPTLDGAARPPERLLTSLPLLDTLTLESTDFEELAYQVFCNPERSPKYSLRVLNVDSCVPWRVGYADPGAQQVARQTYHFDDVHD